MRCYRVKHLKCNITEMNRYIKYFYKNLNISFGIRTAYWFSLMRMHNEVYKLSGLLEITRRIPVRRCNNVH